MKKKLSNLKHKLKDRKIRKSDAAEENADKARITNETIAEHREQVIGRARKYIYPLQHTKHRIVIVSITLLIVTIVAFFTYCTLALYRFQSSSGFLYRVTQVIPFPIARTGGRFVLYENYLFELRHYMHYYENQQELDFKTDEGRAQLADFKRRALDKVINDAYVKQLAEKNGINVNDQELEQQIATVRSQNRLGDNEQVFEDVLKDFWGWSVDDFKRSLRQQLLAQKVVAQLDTETQERAKAALTELKNGASFEEVAKKYSDDPSTKDNGGKFGFKIDRATRDLTARTTETMFNLQAGQNSEVINIGYALEIVMVTKNSGDEVEGAHILFNFKDIGSYINDLKDQQPTKTYITPPENEVEELEPEPQSIP